MTILVDGEAIDYTPLPQNLRGGVERYIENGIPPGGFLTAVICNNLKEAVLRADPASHVALPGIARWFNQFAPPESHGGVDRMNAWAKALQLERVKP